MRLTVEHLLNVHFVDADAIATQAFEHDDVQITVATHRDADAAFFSVTCSGVTDVLDTVADYSQDPDGVLTAGGNRFTWTFPFMLPPDVDPGSIPHLERAFQKTEGLLQHVGSLVRWRFNLSGRDSVFKDTRITLATDHGRVFELQPIAQAAMGDDRAAVESGQLAELQRMLASDIQEPLGHRLWREAWNLRLGNPRSSLVIGVAAAEVGLKQMIATLVPQAHWLVEELPSPPLVPMMKNYLPDLPIKADIPRDRRCPKHLRSTMDAAVKERNAVVHRGIAPNADLRAMLLSVRDFLYLLDFYMGNTWALKNLSEETIEALGVDRP